MRHRSLVAVIVLCAVLAALAVSLHFLQRQTAVRPGQPKGQSGEPSGLSIYVNRTIRYGNDSRCFVLLTYPNHSNSVDLAIYVHGGGFVHGDASLHGVPEVFVENGFAAASVEYRLCPSVNFTLLLSDIASGIRKTVEFLSSKGIHVNLTVLSGSSAGAIADAILLYDPPRPDDDISSLVDAFISMSGGFCSSCAASNPEQKAVLCNISIDQMMPFDRRELGPPDRWVPALLISGKSDKTLDRYADSGYNHQGQCMEKWLSDHDVYSLAVQVDGGHGSPKEAFFSGQEEIVHAVNDLLHHVGWKGEFTVQKTQREGRHGCVGNITLHWPLDGIIDGVVSEKVRSRTGRLEGSASFEKGVIDNAIHLDGSGYVDLSSAIQDISNMHEGTISLWFKFENVNQNVLPILYFGRGDEEEDSLFVIEIGHAKSSNRKLYVTWVTGGRRPALCFDSGYNLDPERWYHLVVVVGKDEGNTAYLNGRLMQNRHYNFGGPKMALFFADIPSKQLFALGYGRTARQITPHFLHFFGLIDDVRIYPYTLDSAEAKQLG